MMPNNMRPVLVAKDCGFNGVGESCFESDEWKLCLLVIKTTVLLADINDFATVNEIYKMCE